MASQSAGLLSKIEQGVVDPNIQLTTLLNMCLVLGGKAKSEKMRDWARQELHGYPDATPETIPAYRLIHAVITIQITNLGGYNPITQNIRNAELPTLFTDRFNTEEMIVGQSVGELEAFVRSGDQDLHFSPGWAPALCMVVNDIATFSHGNSRVAAAYWVIKPATLEGVLGRVRSALADLVAELVALMPEGQVVPDKATVDNAMHFVLTGEHLVVNVITQTAGEHGTNTATHGTGPVTVSTGGGTTVGSQSADNGGTVTGSQNVSGHGVAAGREASAVPTANDSQSGWWARLRKRGAVVALAQILGSLAGILSLVLAVWVIAGWPWPWT